MPHMKGGRPSEYGVVEFLLLLFRHPLRGFFSFGLSPSPGFSSGRSLRRIEIPDVFLQRMAAVHVLVGWPELDVITVWRTGQLTRTRRSWPQRVDTPARRRRNPHDRVSLSPPHNERRGSRPICGDPQGPPRLKRVSALMVRPGDTAVPCSRPRDPVCMVSMAPVATVSGRQLSCRKSPLISHNPSAIYGTTGNSCPPPGTLAALPFNRLWRRFEAPCPAAYPLGSLPTLDVMARVVSAHSNTQCTPLTVGRRTSGGDAIVNLVYGRDPALRRMLIRTLLGILRHSSRS